MRSLILILSRLVKSDLHPAFLSQHSFAIHSKNKEHKSDLKCMNRVIGDREKRVNKKIFIVFLCEVRLAIRGLEGFLKL